jgi:putative oxidoreductase
MDFGLLIVHALLGSLAAAHGAGKLFGWLGAGFGLAGTAAYMESLALRPGRPFALLAGLAELSGGMLLGVGLATPLGAALLAATMLVAALTDHRGKGLWIFKGGAELVLTNAIVAVALAFTGAGRWSLDALAGWDLSGIWWGSGAAGLAVLGAGGALALAWRAPAPGVAPASG